MITILTQVTVLNDITMQYQNEKTIVYIRKSQNIMIIVTIHISGNKRICF